MARWHQAPCMYCCEPVGPDGETDDGEFFVCANCRRSAARRSRQLTEADAEPDIPFELRVTRADLDSYLTHTFGGSANAPESLAERILDRIRAEASGDLDFDREPTVPLDLAPLPAADKQRILAHVLRHGPRFTTYGAARA